MKPKRIRRRTFSGEVSTCAHRVSFWYELPPRFKLTDEIKGYLTNEAEERAHLCISEDGSVTGELCYYATWIEEEICGWWEIIKG